MWREGEKAASARRPHSLRRARPPRAQLVPPAPQPVRAHARTDEPGIARRGNRALVPPLLVCLLAHLLPNGGLRRCCLGRVQRVHVRQRVQQGFLRALGMGGRVQGQRCGGGTHYVWLCVRGGRQDPVRAKKRRESEEGEGRGATGRSCCGHIPLFPHLLCQGAAKPATALLPHGPSRGRGVQHRDSPTSVPGPAGSGGRESGQQQQHTPAECVHVCAAPFFAHALFCSFIAPGACTAMATHRRTESVRKTGSPMGGGGGVTDGWR